MEKYPKKVVVTNGMGGKRVVSMQIGEQLPRISWFYRNLSVKRFYKTIENWILIQNPL